jgi:hypothetical protein
MVELLKDGQSQGSYDIKNLDIALNRAKMGASFFYTLPGPKMLWQFGELGYDKSINYCTNGTISNDCRLDVKPLPWGTGGLNYYTNTDRQRLYKTIAAINRLVQTNKTTFKSGTVETIPLGNVRVIKISSTAMDVAIVGNFSTAYQKPSGVFTKTGTWFDYFGNESITVTDVNETLLMAPGEFHIYTTVQQPSPGTGLVDFVITGIDEISNGSFSVYPNPVKDKSLMIQWRENPTAKVNIKILDLLGRVRMNSEHVITESELRYDVQPIPAGMYVILVEQGGIRKTQKILIE